MQFIDMETVKRLMKEKGVTVGDIAEKMGVTARTVEKHLNGADQTYFKLGHICGYADALRVPVYAILAKDI